MAGDSFGQLFRIHNWGESHGKGIGIIVEGCPPNFPLKEKDIQKDLDRRRPGQSFITTQRNERDKVEILSGTTFGKTTGTPIMLVIYNQDHRSKDYTHLKKLFRPSHADYTYEKKYGIREVAGGGRSSARVMAGNVAAGAIAKKILAKKTKTQIFAYVKSIKNIVCDLPVEKINPNQIESNIIRCPDQNIAKNMIQLIEKTKQDGDSLGGVIETIVKNCPIGLGEPIYDKLEADLAKACLSINACKGFEIGSGFSGTKLLGSQHNDIFTLTNSQIKTKTNYSGGIQGGISNGMDIVIRTAFKPTATILKNQQTVTKQGKKITYKAEGRHDPCVLPRAVPIVEAMVSIVLCDHYLRYQIYSKKD